MLVQLQIMQQQQLRCSVIGATKRIVKRGTANNSWTPFAHPWMTPTKHSPNFSFTRFKTTISSCRCTAFIPVKRKRSSIRRSLGSFTGFDPMTGNNTNDLDTTEALFGSQLSKSKPESLNVKMLRFENQYRMLGPQRSIIELHSLLHFWSRSLSSQPKSVKEMLEWVQSMRGELRLNVSTYQMLLDAFLKRNERMEVAETLLDYMLDVLPKNNRQDDDKQSDDQLEITSVLYCFHNVMALYGKDDNAEATERLLRKLEDTSHEYNILILANESYSIVISSYAKSGKPREAEYVLNSMMNFKVKSLDHSHIKIMPTKANFDSCLNAWVAYPTKESGHRAELLVLKMLELAENGYDTKPNFKSYSKIVHAWVYSKHEYTLPRLDKIMSMIERMDWEGEKDNPYIKQTVAETYLVVMKACSYEMRNRAAVKRCIDYFSRLAAVLGLQNVEYETLQLMYAALIYTWAQSALPETEVRVQEIFNELDIRHKERVAEYQARLGDDLDLEYSAPYLSIAVYRALLHAFAKTGSGQKAEDVLKRMMHEYLDLIENDKSDDTTYLRMVDTSCFNSVLLAWSRSTEADSGYQAEKLFRQMFQSQNSEHMCVRMDVVSYNAVLSAMSGSTDVEVARRGDTYFRQILESEDRMCRATVITYTKAIALWTNIGTAEALKRVDGLMEEMKASNDSYIRPTKQTYKAYLEVLKKCSHLLPPEEYQMRLRETNRMIKKL